MFVDHVAVLTEQLKKNSEALPAFCKKEAVETFPAEGTREQYVTLGKDLPRLLLIEPLSEGPYLRALHKRGPGLHHIGATVHSLTSAISVLSSAGLFMHTVSIATLKQGTIWLCRPGMPFLIELTETNPPESQIPGRQASLSLELPSGSQIPERVVSLFDNLRLDVGTTRHLTLHTGKAQVQLPL